MDHPDPAFSRPSPVAPTAAHPGSGRLLRQASLLARGSGRLHRHAPDSIRLLASHGLDLDAHRTRGVDARVFAALLMSSGLVCCPPGAVTWVTFHSAYDFGYLIKLLIGQKLPRSMGEFLGLVLSNIGMPRHLLRQLAGNHDLVVNVYDVTNDSNPLVMYGSEVPLGAPSPSHTCMLDFGDPFRKHHMICRYRNKPHVPWSAITTPSGVFVICMLVGYIIYAAWRRYVNVKEDCRKMEELKKQAEAADIAKSQFLATVSHEIRTPMNGVLGMLDMLLGTELKTTQRDYAQTAQVCGKALISLINEVLDRAKIEANKLELESVPFDLRSILDDVISLFSPKSREKGIELAVYVSERVPEILLGDPGRFRQIITNLVGNSIKVFSSWMHFCAVRVFAESILRHGLPPSFLSAVLAPSTKSEKKVRSILEELCGNIHSIYWKSEDDMAVAGLGGETEAHPYVSFTINFV